MLDLPPGLSHEPMLNSGNLDFHLGEVASWEADGLLGGHAATTTSVAPHAPAVDNAGSHTGPSSSGSSTTPGPSPAGLAQLAGGITQDVNVEGGHQRSDEQQPPEDSMRQFVTRLSTINVELYIASSKIPTLDSWEAQGGHAFPNREQALDQVVSPGADS